ncbi:hypothetical protein ERT44_20955, partial [Stenotrophomonas sp. MA5]
HLANVQEKEGRKVSLEYSELLQKLLDTLAAEAGQTADEYLDALVAPGMHCVIDVDRHRRGRIRPAACRRRRRPEQPR